MTLRVGSRALACAFVAACAGTMKPPGMNIPRACGGLESAACGRAEGLLAAASAFSTVRHEYILDPTSSFAPGRGLEQSGASWTALPIACAKPQGSPSASAAPRLDAQVIDFGFVGVSIDSVLVSADADISAYFSAGAAGGSHRVRLVAIAFVRDLDPQFFEATDEVSLSGQACACRSATHFVGAVKMGGMLAYETTVSEGEVHAKALDFVKAKIAARTASVTETRVGGLEVTGLDEPGDPASASGARKPLSFRVSQPVPIAYAVYPVADVCKLGFPAPDVSPALVDFGDTPYGRESTRLLHVVNRAPFELRATVGARVVDVGARASADVPVSWAPQGDVDGCDPQQRDETLVFAPKQAGAPVTPAQQSVRLVETVRSGKARTTRMERVDTGERRSPDYAATARDWTCPPDYAVAGCRTQSEACGGVVGGCSSQSYSVSADVRGNGCHFGCKGPSSLLFGSNFCRFDAVMDCKLSCGAATPGRASTRAE